MGKRSDRMYGNSPKLGKDEDGKVSVKREHKSQQVAAGTDGVQEHDSKMMEMEHRHAKERLELNQKHELDHHKLASKHMKAMHESADMAPHKEEHLKAGSEPEGAPKKKEHDAGKGESKINKIEKDKKE